MGQKNHQMQFDLPLVIPVFPLSGAILLPGCLLPLTIFEPRYMTMIRSSLESNRLIGMIQPKIKPAPFLEGAPWPTDKPPLFDIGCAGLIERANALEDGRFFVELRGLCRYRIHEELTVTTPYRQVQADWTGFEGDHIEEDRAKPVARQELLSALKRFLDQKGLSADFEAISSAPDRVLANTLSMIVPLNESEKQALIEAPCLQTRARTLTDLLEMAAKSHATSPHNPH